jgi:hypothetical protein
MPLICSKKNCGLPWKKARLCSGKVSISCRECLKSGDESIAEFRVRTRHQDARAELLHRLTTAMSE